MAGILIYLFTHKILLILSILLVTCADDLAIAIPLAFMASITAAAKRGIIIKGANYLEAFAKVKAIVFDKTGTLTRGKPKAQNMMVFNGQTENDFLAILAGLMEESNHPVANAVCRFVKEKNIKFLDINKVHEEPGFGMKGEINDKSVFAGSVKFLQDNGVEIFQNEQGIFDKEKSLGRSLVVVGLGKKLIGFVSLADSIRKEAPQIVDEFRKLGIEKIFMLTGDNEQVAAQVAQEAHIKNFRAGFLPQDKVFFKGAFKQKI